MPSSGSEIVIEHVFRAPLEQVWRAWTSPEAVRTWWGSDPAGVVIAADLDVRVGGRFEIAFRDSSGVEHTCSGVYLRVRPMTELEFTWSWASEPGRTSRVAVALEQGDDGTRMRFVHGDLFTASEHDYAVGWRSTFAKLDETLAAREDAS